MLFNTTLSDLETGYKAFRTEILRSLDLTQDGFAIEPEITAKVCRRKLRIDELPIAYYGRTYAEGKKITWRGRAEGDRRSALDPDQGLNRLGSPVHSLARRAGPPLAGLLLAVATTWPLAAKLTRVVASDLQDPLFQTWVVAWGGHALLRQPLHYFQANAFWPLADSLAFSDALVGYAPIGLLGDGSGAALVHYNLLYLLAYTLAFVGAYLLARELGAGIAGGAVAGVAYAYAPWRLSQSGHLHVLSSGGIPLALFLLLRGYRTGRAHLVLTGWLVATWQLSLGFTLGLPFAYVLSVLVLLGLVSRVRRARSFGRGVVRASVLGASVFVVAGALLARPYFRVVDEFPEARRTSDEVIFFSPSWRSYVVAPAENLIWGDVTAPLRESLRFPVEQSLFPGAVILGLALLGLAVRTYPARLRLGLGAAGAAVALLSMGFQQGGLSQYLPYRLLYEVVPGWQGVRTPSRLMTLTTLALALLAAGGAQALAGLAARSRRRWAAAATTAVLAAGVLVEGYGVPKLPRVPEPPEALHGLPGPQLHLPFDIRHDQTYMYWSVEGFPPLVNGLSGFEPLSIRRLREVMRQFPDQTSIAALRALGVRTVVLYPSLATGTPWRETEQLPVAGLPILRRKVEGVVVYDIAR